MAEITTPRSSRHLRRTTKRFVADASHELVDLAEIVTLLVADIRRQGIAIEVHHLDSPALIVGEMDQLRKLVRNLLHNAEEHASALIETTVERQPHLVRLTIADDGPGIPTADRERATSEGPDSASQSSRASSQHTERRSSSSSPQPIRPSHDNQQETTTPTTWPCCA